MTRWWVALTVAASIAMPAHAATQWRVEPSLRVGGGLDDNVLFDNSGGDGIARGSVRLLARAWERHWNAFADTRVATATFALRGQTILLGELHTGGGVDLGRHLSARVRARVRTSDDPLGLAQFGVLGAQGRTFTFKGDSQLAWALDRRHELHFVGSFQGVTFLDPAFAARDGAALGVAVVANRRQTRAVALRAGVEARGFLGPSFASSVGLVPGVRLRLMRRTFLDVAGGALALSDAGGTLPVWIARLRLEKDWRQAGVALAASNDLTVPSGRAGVLESQLVEGVTRWGTNHLELRARVGLYRSRSTGDLASWAPGWGAEVDAFVHAGGPVWLGLSALRFERLATDHEPAIARDAVYLHVDVTGGRP